MSAAPDWITAEDVAGYLDLPGTPDDNLTLSTASWKAAVERRHPRYFDAESPPVFFPPADVRLGAIRAAALTYQSRNAPSGFAGYGDETMLFDSLGAQRGEIMRQLRWREPVAR